MSDLPHSSESSHALSAVLGDRYQLIKQIGEGGTSQVYEAQHQLTGERVALKVIPLKRMGDQKTIARFLREAKLTQGMSHPGFVQVLDAWIDSNQRCCLVMERLYGLSLREMTSVQRPSRAEVMEILQAVLEPLELAHERGIIHRDLKPENIFIHRPEDAPEQEPIVKLLDFGLGRSVLSPTVTHTGQFVGTPWYISPEQAFSPKQCEASADVWSVGVILYELLTDQVPFDGESLPMICMAIKQDAHRAVVELNPQIHPALSALIDRCLDKDPERRPQDAGELKSELAAIERFFLSEEGEVQVSAGAIRGTPATLDVDQLTSDGAPNMSDSLALAFGVTLDHDTDSEQEVKSLSQGAVDESNLTVPLSSDEIAERLQALDQERLELEQGPTAIGTLKVIDWPEEQAEGAPNREGPHALDTESMTARDDLLALIEDPLIDDDYLDSDAVTVRRAQADEHADKRSDTLRGAPQSLWSEEDLIEDELSETSVISEVQDLGEAQIFTPKPPAQRTEALSSKHTPPPTLVGTPNPEEELGIHEVDTSVNHRRDRLVSHTSPSRAHATTQRKVRGPFSSQALDYQESEVTPILNEERPASRSSDQGSWSRPMRPPSQSLSPKELTTLTSYSDDQRSPNTLLWVSILVFVSALIFALWTARAT